MAIVLNLQEMLITYMLLACLTYLPLHGPNLPELINKSI